MQQISNKTKGLLAVVLGAVIILLVCVYGSTCSFSGSKYEVLSEDVAFTAYDYTEASPKAVVKVKNTSKGSIKMSFSANIYYDGELFASVLSNVLTLESGDTGTFTAVTTKKIDSNYMYSNKWTVKITKWNMY